MQEYCCNMVADGGMKHDIIPCCILTCVTSVTGKIILFVKKFIQLAREGRSNNDEDTGVMENTGTDSKTMKINISFNIISHVASFPLLFGIFCRNSKQRVQTQNIFLLSYFVAQRNSIDLPLPALLASRVLVATVEQASLLRQTILGKIQFRYFVIGFNKSSSCQALFIKTVLLFQKFKLF